MPFFDTGLVQLRVSDGKELLRTPACSGAARPPGLDSPRLYVTTPRGLVAFDLE